MDDYPGNSRSRPTSPSEDEKAPVEDKKLESVVTGNVIRRKKPLGRRLRETFFSSDPDSVLSYVVHEVLVPAAKELITKMVQQGVEKAVYGEVQSSGRSSMVRGSSMSRPHISYDRPSSIVRSSSNSSPIGRRPSHRSALDIGEIIVNSQIEAKMLREKMYETLEEYDNVSVADLLSLVNQTSTSTDYKYGWKPENFQMDWRQVRGGYLLQISEPIFLK